MKKRNVVILVGALLIVFLPSCTSNDPVFVSAADPVQGKGLVYVYRPTAFQNAIITPAIRVDDSMEFKIPNGGYTPIYLDEGKHTFRLVLSDSYSGSLTTECNIESKRIYYIEVVSRFGMNMTSTKRVFGLKLVDSNQALDKLKNTKLIDVDKIGGFEKKWYADD